MGSLWKVRCWILFQDSKVFMDALKVICLIADYKKPVTSAATSMYEILIGATSVRFDPLQFSRLDKSNVEHPIRFLSNRSDHQANIYQAQQTQPPFCMLA